MPFPSSNAEWQPHLELLSNYANLNGWRLLVGPERQDMADGETLLITIKTNKNKEDQLYVTLHEMGHMVIFSQHDYDRRFVGMLHARAKGAYGLQTYRVERVQEELEAWDQGLNLANQLGIPVDKEKFRRMKARNVSTYMIWAQKRKIDSLVKTNQPPPPTERYDVL